MKHFRKIQQEIFSSLQKKFFFNFLLFNFFVLFSLPFRFFFLFFKNLLLR